MYKYKRDFSGEPRAGGCAGCALFVLRRARRGVGGGETSVRRVGYLLSAARAARAARKRLLKAFLQLQASGTLRIAFDRSIN